MTPTAPARRATGRGRLVPATALLSAAALFWAEGIIAAGLAWTAWCGIRTEHRLLREREADTEGL